MLRRELARGWPAPVCYGLPIRKAWCFAYQVSALYNYFADTGCLRCSLLTLLLKPVTSIAEKLLEKVLTFFCGFR
jgi:hypothetical protein